MDDSKRQLMWHGMFLFLLGLLTGFLEQKFVNPRMGLAAHLEGVMNGTFLLALGAAWTEVRLSFRLKTAAYWTAFYGAYVNWVATILAAIFGAAALSPITSAGHRGAALAGSTHHYCVHDRSLDHSRIIFAIAVGLATKSRGVS